MEINDRGTKKWTSLMLPEHVEMLKDVFVERKEKPELDEQQIAENEFKLKGSLRGKCEVRITYFENHDFHKVEGLINNIINEDVYVDNKKVKFVDIIEVDFVHSIFDEY